MAFLNKVFKKSDDVDMDEFLNNLDVEQETTLEDADAYVKPISLEKEEDTQIVIDEAKKGNIVLLNIGDLAKRNSLKLRDYVTIIRNAIEQIDGDMARISQDRVLVTPSKVKIIKRRE